MNGSVAASSRRGSRGSHAWKRSLVGARRAAARSGHIARTAASTHLRILLRLIRYPLAPRAAPAPASEREPDRVRPGPKSIVRPRVEEAATDRVVTAGTAPRRHDRADRKSVV